MSTVSVTYADVPITAVPSDWSQLFPGRRINYFDVPWTASTWGRGKVLVTSDDLTTIRGRINRVNQRQIAKVLRLHTMDDVTLEIEDKVELNDIWVTAARPVLTSLEGRLRGKGDKEKITLQPGLWELELVDNRYFHYGKVVNLRANVREPGGTCYFEDSLEDKEEVWTYVKLLRKIFEETMGITGISFTEVNNATKKTSDISGLITRDELLPEDIVFTQIPAPLAIDRLLNEIGLALWYNAENSSEETRWTFKSFEDRRLLDVLMIFRTNRHEQGGEGIVFPIVSANQFSSWHRTELSTGSAPAIPARLANGISPASLFSKGYREITGVSGHSETVLGTKKVVSSNKRVPRTAVPAPVGLADRVTQPVKDRAESIGVLEIRYMGFIDSFIGVPGLTLVSFEWSRVPYTYIERRPIRPAGQIMKNRLAAQIRGEPSWMGISTGASMMASMDESGWLHLETAPMWFIGKVVKTYNTTNEGVSSSGNADGCTVQPLEKDPAIGVAVTSVTIDHVWCFKGSWIEIGDTVLCFYIGHADRQWVAVSMPPVVTDEWCDPEDSCRLTGTTSCVPCDDPTRYPSQDLGEKKEEGTATLPKVLTCFGKPE